MTNSVFSNSNITIILWKNDKECQRVQKRQKLPKSKPPLTTRKAKQNCQQDKLLGRKKNKINTKIFTQVEERYFK